MLKKDGEYIDEMLKVLYESDNRQPVYVHESLSYLFEPDYIHTNEFDDLSARIRAELEAHNLAEGTGFGTVMRITPFGRLVYKAGGWIQYNQQIVYQNQAEQKRQEEAHQATISSSNATVDAATSAKRSLYAAYISSAIALAALIFSGIQWLDARQSQNEVSSLNSKVKVLDSLLQARLSTQTPSKVISGTITAK